MHNAAMVDVMRACFCHHRDCRACVPSIYSVQCTRMCMMVSNRSKIADASNSLPDAR